MSEPEPFISLGLTSPQAKAGENLPAAETLQFRRAEHVSADDTGQRCFSCAKSINATYFHVQGKVACPECAAALESRLKAPPGYSLLRASVYGFGAAIAGCALYATVAIVTGLEIALIAILIGYMVGKAIRHASGGLGGRPQQILAVALTYFSISTSFIPVAIYHFAKEPQKQAQQTDASVTVTDTARSPKAAPTSFGAALFGMLVLGLAAPFLSLSDGPGGILSLVIIFFGLQRAWRVTGRPEIAVMGPYQVDA